jgi:hypothetical protein
MIRAGHQPKDAERRAEAMPACATAGEEAVSARVAGNVALWDEISSADPGPWMLEAFDAANRWAQYRGIKEYGARGDHRGDGSNPGLRLVGENDRQKRRLEGGGPACGS